MIYELIYEDLTHLGGPMGTEYTTNHFKGIFTSEEKAKKAAEEDYGKSISWRKDEEELHSPDLIYVMYHIVGREVK